MDRAVDIDGGACMCTSHAKTVYVYKSYGGFCVEVGNRGEFLCISLVVVSMRCTMLSVVPFGGVIIFLVIDFRETSTLFRLFRLFRNLCKPVRSLR